LLAPDGRPHRPRRTKLVRRTSYVLEVTEDLDLSGLDPDDPDTAPFAVYWWLGVLEERLIDLLSASL